MARVRTSNAGERKNKDSHKEWERIVKLGVHEHCQVQRIDVIRKLSLSAEDVTRKVNDVSRAHHTAKFISACQTPIKRFMRYNDSSRRASQHFCGTSL